MNTESEGQMLTAPRAIDDEAIRGLDLLRIPVARYVPHRDFLTLADMLPSSSPTSKAVTVWDRLYDFFRDQGSVIAGVLAVGAAYYAIRATKDAAKRQVDAAEDSAARQVVAMEKQLQEMREPAS